MKSMTAYASTLIQLGSKRYRLEIQTLNKKGLDIMLDTPSSFYALSIPIRLCLAKHIERGSVWLRLKEDYEEQSGLDLSSLKNLKMQLETTAMHLGFDAGVVTFDLVLEKLPLLNYQQEADFDQMEPYVLKTLDALNRMRKAEGERLKKDLLTRLDWILQQVHTIEDLEKKTPQMLKQKLLERLKLMGLDNSEDERFFKEVVYLVDRSDVSEEIVRLKSHISQFKIDLDKTETIGRRLEFLVQECFREINTLSSKSSELTSVNLALSIKNELEKIKEQVMNIE